jgi:predicted  nucleic acid-binding Zn-ribbon protein
MSIASIRARIEKAQDELREIDKQIRKLEWRECQLDQLISKQKKLLKNAKVDDLHL